MGGIGTIGVIIGADIPMFLGSMIMGPLGGLVIKHIDRLLDKRIPAGFEMVINNFSLGIAGMIVILPMAAYPIARKMQRSRVYRTLYFFMLIGIFVPFQVKMMPLVKIAGA